MKIKPDPTTSVIPRISGCIFLSGATASGKTTLGVLLAQQWNAEIISLDSMAIYRTMDIGTAKPTFAERQGVPHHLIDIVNPWEEYSLASYLNEAQRVVEDIRARGRNVLFVGGTPLYLKGALRGIFNGPSADPILRQEFEDEEKANGPGWLHLRLEQCDPITALRLHPNDRRRIIRALEVYEKTGTPISVFQKQFDRPASSEEATVFVLDWDRDLLYTRINRRVEIMMEQGLEEEARSLLHQSKPPGRTASQAVGYRELFDYFTNKTTLPEAVELIQQHSRNFAKSQGTWFRSLPECQFLPVDKNTNWNLLADHLVQSHFVQNHLVQNIESK